MTYYVDSRKGKDSNCGDKTHPVKHIEVLIDRCSVGDEIEPVGCFLLCPSRLQMYGNKITAKVAV